MVDVKLSELYTKGEEFYPVKHAYGDFLIRIIPFENGFYQIIIAVGRKQIVTLNTGLRGLFVSRYRNFFNVTKNGVFSFDVPFYSEVA